MIALEDTEDTLWRILGSQGRRRKLGVQRCIGAVVERHFLRFYARTTQKRGWGIPQLESPKMCLHRLFKEFEDTEDTSWPIPAVKYPSDLKTGQTFYV
jgi:hypothetical protein